MDENELLRDQEEYNKLLALQERIQDEIANAIREGKETVTIGNKVIMNVKLLENEEEDGESSIDRYRVESKDKSITAKATKNKDGKIEVDVDFDDRTIKNILNAKRQKEHEDELKIKKHEVDGKDSELLKKEIEEKEKTGKAKKLSNREFSDSENAIMFFKRAFGVSATEIYRVQGKDHHDFKYVYKDADGKYKQLDASSRHEGRNPNQKVWLMKDGKLVEKRVDSLLIKGQYAIATDFPDSIASENTTTYLTVRLPNGQYIGTEVGEQYGVNRNTSGDRIQKDYMARAKSKYQLEDIVKACELAKKSQELFKDKKLTTDEIELVRKLQKDKGLSEKQTIEAANTINILKELGFEKDEVKKFMEESKDSKEIEAKAENVKQAKDEGKSKKEFEDDPKLPGGGYMRRGYDPKHPD